MRRKITEPEQVSIADELPELTPQQTEFVHQILSGKTASDAYRAAYNCSKMQNNTIWAAASRLRSDCNVAAWISKARESGLSAGVCTLEDHIAELQRLKEIAIKTGNVGAAVQAEQLRGKAVGHYVEQVRDLTDRHNPEDTLKQIADLAPDLARKLALQHGLDWPEHGTLQ